MDTGWGTTYLPNWIWAVELSLTTGLPVAIGGLQYFLKLRKRRRIMAHTNYCGRVDCAYRGCDGDEYQ